MLGNLLGSGEFPPGLHAELEAEGLVASEEALLGSIRYDRYRAPGKRFNRKVTGERFAIALTEVRVVVYSRSGRVELVDSPFTAGRLQAIEASVDEKGRLSLRIDYDRIGEAGVEGLVTLRMRTPNAAPLARELEARLPR